MSETLHFRGKQVSQYCFLKGKSIMRSRITGQFSVVCLTVLALGAVSARANMIGYTHLDPNSSQTVSLEDLTGGGHVPGVVVGDKIFNNFTYSATGDMPLSSGVSVSGIIDNSGNFGIRFQGGFTDLLDQGVQKASDASITFDVAVSPEGLMQGYLISDAHLSGSGVGNFDLAGPGSFISVDENFVDNDPTIVGGITAFASNFGPGGQQLEDWIFFDNYYEKLSVQKDILAFSSGLGRLPARMTIIDQTFSQVPEPTTLGIACLGLACMACGRKRK